MGRWNILHDKGRVFVQKNGMDEFETDDYFEAVAGIRRDWSSTDMVDVDDLGPYVRWNHKPDPDFPPILREGRLKKLAKDGKIKITHAVRQKGIEGMEEDGIFNFQGRKYQYKIRKGQSRIKRWKKPKKDNPGHKYQITYFDPKDEEGKREKTWKFKTHKGAVAKRKELSEIWRTPEKEIPIEKIGDNPGHSNPGNPGKDNPGSSGKDSLVRGILIVGVVLIFLLIIIWLWKGAKAKEEDQGPPDPAKHQAKVEWYDHVDRSEEGLEKWIGHPAQGYWIAIEHRWPSPGSGVEYEYWSLSVFPYPGGNPYTGQGSQIGLGGSKPSLQEMWECQAVHEHLQVKGYVAGWQWLQWMIYTVFPNDFGVMI